MPANWGDQYNGNGGRGSTWRVGLDAGAVGVVWDICLFLSERVCRRKHKIELAVVGRRGELSFEGDGGRHYAASGSGAAALMAGRLAR